MYIKRSMENVILRFSKQYPTILLTGPRQVGKTTALQKLMEVEGRNLQAKVFEDCIPDSLVRPGTAGLYLPSCELLY